MWQMRLGNQGSAEVASEGWITSHEVYYLNPLTQICSDDFRGQGPHRLLAAVAPCSFVADGTRRRLLVGGVGSVGCRLRSSCPRRQAFMQADRAKMLGF